MDVEDFWRPFEGEADSLAKVQDYVQQIFDKWSVKKRVLAWRGQRDASWPLHSSLYRRLLWTSRAGSPSAEPPTEDDVAAAEHTILVELHRWGLHMSQLGRLPVLAQLAALQHYGAPTRLIDVTFNPWIGLWFAVQDEWKDGERQPDIDARLFAIDVTDRLINEASDLRSWEDDLDRPWPKTPGKSERQEVKDTFGGWVTRTFAWKPPHFHPRLAAQNGGFIFGGVPQKRSGSSLQWPKDESPQAKRWKIAEVRDATSVALRVHKLGSQKGGPSSNAVYTIRIKSGAIEKIRVQLESLFGHRHSTMYPDFTGFSDFAVRSLRNSPP